MSPNATAKNFKNGIPAAFAEFIEFQFAFIIEPKVDHEIPNLLISPASASSHSSSMIASSVVLAETNRRHR